MPVCGHCRKENPPEARFCLACGVPISGGDAVVADERKVVTVLFADLVGFTGRASASIRRRAPPVAHEDDPEGTLDAHARRLG